MPIPWTTGPTVIPELQDRGITVQQLRDLKLLLQRLCKTGLLVQDGARVGWEALNMYHITKLVIKPLVTHLHEKCPQERRDGLAKCPEERKGRLSWVELVASSSQPPRILMSHWWGGRFSDFMNTVEAVVTDRCYGTKDAIWICTFANSQFGEEFGDSLEQSPFYRAISAAEGTVLVADRKAGSLDRIWCGFELHVTITLEKDLAIYTSRGQVGSTAVTSGPLVEALKSWDIKRCEASEDGDRRQILNYLVGESEHKGLKKKDGWKKVLESTATTAPGGRLRANGKLEFLYEDELFSRSKNCFDRISETVRSKVTEAVEGEREKPGQKARRAYTDKLAADVGACFVTLGQIRRFVNQVKKGLVDKTGDSSYSKVSTRTLVDDLFPTQKRVELFESYEEKEPARPLRAQYMIEHLYDGRFSETATSIEWFAEARQLTDTATFWWDILDFETESKNYSSKEAYDELRQNAQGSLFAWPTEPTGAAKHDVDLNRAFVMNTLQVCLSSGKVVDFVSAKGAIACTRPFADGSWALGNFSPSTARKLATIDSSKCEATIRSHQEQLREQISESPGGFEGLNNRLRRVAAGPVVLDAAFQGCPEDIAEIQRLCDTPGLVLNSGSMKGALHTTAVHVAAAAGHHAALKALLDLGADSNAKDHIDETPLHYAAFAGQAASAKLLLSRGANADAESVFAETPLAVAKQSVAEFRGVDTTRVIDLLTGWKESDNPMPRNLPAHQSCDAATQTSQEPQGDHVFPCTPDSDSHFAFAQPVRSRKAQEQRE